MKPHLQHEVLVVDPDDEIRLGRTLLLQMHGFRTTGARSSSDTLRRLRAGFRPCVVVADPRAPGAAGWDLVDFLRADSVLITVPLVLVARDALQAKCAHWHGIRECLFDVTATSLVTAIERQCRRRPWSRRAPAATPSIAAPPPTTPTMLRRPA